MPEKLIDPGGDKGAAAAHAFGIKMRVVFGYARLGASPQVRRLHRPRPPLSQHRRL